MEWYPDYLAEESGQRQRQVAFPDLFPHSRLKVACRQRTLVEDVIAGLKGIESNAELDAIRTRYFAAIFHAKARITRSG